MRVYEFSKKHGLSNQEILDALRAGSFSVKSHMSLLTDDALAFLQERFVKKPETTKPEAQKVAKNTVHIQSESKKSFPPQKTRNLVQHQRATQDASPVKKIQPQPKPQEQKEEPRQVILAPMSVAQAAEKMGVSANEMIIVLLGWGVVANKNQTLTIDVVGRLARHYEIPVVKKEVATQEEFAEINVEQSKLQERLPVVVVMGHVDHGKTTLLDYTRNTRVASREKGGITQHLGAYEVGTSQGNVVFLDTPGHEAFSKIRMRGARIADIAILVIAADDSIKPQTIEAIKHAKDAKVTIIVAINKIDKADEKQIERVKQDLAKHDLLSEDWGGKTICVPISAKLGTNVDQLLEMVVLQAQLMELKAEAHGPAKAYVLEAKIEKGRGPVATVISRHGQIKVGDYFACGSTFGHVSTLIDSYGKRRSSVGPSVPVQVAGFADLPNAGDFFEVIDKEAYRKARMASTGYQSGAEKNLMQEGAINIIIKADSNLSKEALVESIHKVSKQFEKGFNIIYAGVGDITESDVALAANTDSKIYGMHVKSELNAVTLAKRNSVSLFFFDIIYKLLEDLERIAHASKEIKMVRKKIGEAVVRKVFEVKNVGVIAGSYINDGIFTKGALVVGWRGKQKLGEGKIKSLQRDRNSVKEVHKGFECGFVVSEISDWQEDDRAECYIEVPEKQ